MLIFVIFINSVLIFFSPFCFVMDVLRKRQRFTDNDDLSLLREVLAQNPFENPARWEVIREHVLSVTGKTFSIRTLKEHLERLVKMWLEQYNILKDKSGIEIQVTEKENMVHNVYDLMREFKNVPPKKKKMSSDCAAKIMGVEARNKWTRLLGDSSNIVESTSRIHNYASLESPSVDAGRTVYEVYELENETSDIEPEIQLSVDIPGPSCTEDNVQMSLPTPNGMELQQTPIQASSNKLGFKPSRILDKVRSRKRKLNSQRQGLAYLEQYDKQQAALKQRELELDERKLILEEKKVELMEKQQNLAEFKVKKQLELEEKKINLEIQSRSNLEKLIERQDKVLNLLINKLT